MTSFALLQHLSAIVVYSLYDVISNKHWVSSTLYYTVDIVIGYLKPPPAQLAVYPILDYQISCTVLPLALEASRPRTGCHFKKKLGKCVSLV
jgi:hypothetical protein